MGRKNSGTLEKRIKDDQTSQGARRSPRSANEASDEWNTAPGESFTGSGRGRRARTDATDETISTRATKMQPRVRTDATDPNASTSRRRLTGSPASSGRNSSSRYSLPGQSGIIYRGSDNPDADDTLTSLATPESTGTYPEASSARRRTTVGPASSGATGEQPAIATDGDGTRTSSTSRRRITSARPVRAEDRALVAATTQMLQAIEVVQDDAVEAEATHNLPVVREDTSVVPFEVPQTENVSVTVVPGTLAPAPAWLTHRPRHRRRSVISGALTCIIALGLILGVLETVSPISASPAQLQSFTLLTGQLNSGDNAGAPTGPWDTSAGAADTLGLGGGAAPGTKAPGSAGLPSTGKSGSGSSKAGPSTHISPAPLHPWPPYNQFKVYPPGYSSFGVTEPKNDYYYWAFGQCTWWAQHQRSDENLRHMGNAMYWAGSAKARGYRVGNTPAVGATVVFQPGVQGAGGAGHVAHVVKVYPNGWFLVSEMNFYWDGGGWGRVDYRYAHSGGGVSFIY